MEPKTESSSNHQFKEYNDAVYPLYYELTNNKEKLEMKKNVKLSSNINYPRFEYGFHHFIHQSKNYFNDETKKFEGKKKVWTVLNRYEQKIDNYEETIEENSKKYYGDITKINVLNNNFYVLWEILLYCNLFTNKSDISTAHLYDDGFLQSIIYYRDKFVKPSGDKYYYVIGKDIKDVVDVQTTDYVDFKKYYSKKITDVKFDAKQKCDLITACGDFKMNDNLKETFATELLLNEIQYGLKNLKKGGVFICKFFELYTNISIELLSLLQSVFKKVSIIKPLTSPLTLCEKYVVCENYNDEGDKIISLIDGLLKEIGDRKNENVIEICDMEINKNMILDIITFNTIFSNVYYKALNLNLTYLKKQIFSGDDYYKYRDDQMDGTKYFTKTYLTNKISEDTYKQILNVSMTYFNNKRALYVNKLKNI